MQFWGLFVPRFRLYSFLSHFHLPFNTVYLSLSKRKKEQDMRDERAILQTKFYSIAAYYLLESAHQF